MAHKKGLGSSRNARDSHEKRPGGKVFAGQTVTGGRVSGGWGGTCLMAAGGAVAGIAGWATNLF